LLEAKKLKEQSTCAAKVWVFWFSSQAKNLSIGNCIGAGTSFVTWGKKQENFARCSGIVFGSLVFGLSLLPK